MYNIIIMLFYVIYVLDFGRDTFEEVAMDSTKEKIKSTSMTIFVVLLVMAGFLTISALYNTWEMLDSSPGMSIAPDSEFTLARTLMSPYCFAVLGVFTAFIFKSISAHETPFTKDVPQRIKIAAVLLFLSIALPQWLGYLLHSAATGIFSFTLFDETVILALVLSAIVFCLAQIFEYGFMVQDENYEIL